MIRAALFGAAVTLGLILIPIVHWVTAIPSPFIGGYFAGVRSGVTPERAFALSGLMASLMLVPIAVGLLVFLLFVDLSLPVVFAVAGGGFVYVAVLGGLGAVLGGAHQRRQAAS